MHPEESKKNEEKMRRVKEPKEQKKREEELERAKMDPNALQTCKRTGCGMSPQPRTAESSKTRQSRTPPLPARATRPPRSSRGKSASLVISTTIIAFALSKFLIPHPVRLHVCGAFGSIFARSSSSSLSSFFCSFSSFTRLIFLFVLFALPGAFRTRSRSEHRGHFSTPSASSSLLSRSSFSSSVVRRLVFRSNANPVPGSLYAQNALKSLPLYYNTAKAFRRLETEAVECGARIFYSSRREDSRKRCADSAEGECLTCCLLHKNSVTKVKKKLKSRCRQVFDVGYRARTLFVVVIRIVYIIE